MNIVTLKPPNEDKAMQTVRQFVLEFARRFDPSWLMAILTMAVYLALDVSHDEQGAPMLNWALRRIYELTGLSLSEYYWRVGLFASSIIIACFRPTPRWTLICSFPLLTYIGFAAWYGWGAHQLPYTVVVFVLFAFAGVFVIHLQAGVILVSLRTIGQLEQEKEALLQERANVPPTGQ